MCIVNERNASGSLGLSAVERLISEMNDADHKADGFRFPTNAADAAFAFGDRGVDLDNLRDVMQGLENFFECVNLAFSQEDAERSEYYQAVLASLP